ncbi:MAG: YeeE/YedE family protein [Proteobacteria bacterium]|nr:YeeE/YedE family protein [Pseudomonadota bacterium]
MLPKPPDETIIAFLGGIMVGVGAALGGGCVVGHIMSGVALMSIASILFFGAVVLSNWVTTRLYLLGF